MIRKGVPQESILEPTLFLIYFNRLPDVQQAFVVIFADDAFVVLIHLLKQGIVTTLNYNLQLNIKQKQI